MTATTNPTSNKDNMDNPFVVTLVVLLMLAIAFGLVSLFLWWIIPLAFPLLPFSFGNAMALAGLILVLNIPGAMKS